MIRRRADRDLAACVEVLRAVHASDRYPVLWPEHPVAWLTPSRSMAAWVAERGAAVIGHVALCSIADSDMIWTDLTGLHRRSLAAITRLFVAPEHRRKSIGSALLAEACHESTRLERVPVLEVVETHEHAAKLYETHGWRCVARRPWSPDPQRNVLYYASFRRED